MGFEFAKLLDGRTWCTKEEHGVMVFVKARLFLCRDFSYGVCLRGS